MVSVSSCDLWENIPVPHAPFQIPHSTSIISHPTFHIQHSNIPHLTLHNLNTPPPNLHCFSRRAPPRVQIRHSRTFLQPSNIQPLTAQRAHSVSHTPHSAPRKAMFRPSIPALSRLHLLPFEARYLSPRNPKHAQRPIPPLPLPTQNAPKDPPATLFRPKAQHTFYTKISYCRALNMKHRITFHVTPADLHFLHPSGQWVR